MRALFNSPDDPARRFLMVGKDILFCEGASRILDRVDGRD
jgi:hypothetical protein